MIYISFPKAELKESPTSAVDRLRANWFNPHVYLVLDNVSLQTFDDHNQPVPDTYEEHLLIGLEGDSPLLYQLPQLLKDWDMPAPFLWDPKNVQEAVERQTTFYTEDGINWERMYQALEVTQMHWYWDALDPDLEQALDLPKIQSGTFLDLGTGPGTQAIALAQRGFTVTATDISKAAISKARKRAKAQGAHVRFLMDDVLRSRLNESFDYVFDRGLFHTVPPESRSIYIQTVAKLVRPKGLLFLKTFSVLEADWGPYRFTPRDIRKLFTGSFHIESVKETVMHGTRKPLPLALFTVLRKTDKLHLQSSQKANYTRLSKPPSSV